MDLGEKEKFGLEKKSVCSLNCHTSTTEWNQIGSVSMADSFTHSLWNTHSLSSAASSSTIGKPVPLSWNPSDSLTKGAMFISSTGPGMHHPLALSSHAPSDSGFIDRAAMFSCFGGQMQKSDAGKIEAFDDSGTGMKFSEPDLSGKAPEDPPYTSKGGIASKKRKRSNQGMELDQPCEAAAKEVKEGEEAPMENYIHVRARRGQATNSHSLAERVRREKISERMKFLQDLVPGCSKVTGKAVMLDEIINYVQSLQRQVEFLSMKLSAVNPRSDFNVEGLPSKDMFQNSSGSSSTIGFLPDMIHHPHHLSLIQAGMHGAMNPIEAFRRAINVQLPSTSGFKDATQQVPNAWDDHLLNVTHMAYDNNPPLKTQDLNGAPGDAFPL